MFGIGCCRLVVIGNLCAKLSTYVYSREYSPDVYAESEKQIDLKKCTCILKMKLQKRVDMVKIERDGVKQLRYQKS